MRVSEPLSFCRKNEISVAIFFSSFCENFVVAKTSLQNVGDLDHLFGSTKGLSYLHLKRKSSSLTLTKSKMKLSGIFLFLVRR